MADELNIKERIEAVIFRNDSIEAMDVLEEVNGLLESASDEQTRTSLDAVRVRLTAVAMKFFSVEQLSEVFEASANIVFSLDIDLKNNFKNFLLTQPFLEDKDGARSKIKEALEHSEGRLTTPELTLGTNPVPPTVANWLKVYVSETGTERASSVATARFFSQDKNVQKLNPTENERLKRLFDFYEYLKLESNSAAGFDGDLLFTDKDGIVWKLNSSGQRRLFNEEDLKAQRKLYDQGEITRTEYQEFHQYFPEPEFDKYFKFEEAKDLSPAEVQSHIQGFFNDQRSKFPSTAAAASSIPEIVSERQGVFKKVTISRKPEDVPLAIELFKAVVKDKKGFREFMKSDHIQKFLQLQGKQYVSEKNKTVLQQSPYGPLAFQALLQAVFEGVLSLSSEEAAYRSYQVAQSFPLELRDYKTLISYDVTQRRLVWRY